jgi:hypothetical protein
LRLLQEIRQTAKSAARSDCTPQKRTPSFWQNEEG